jgi:hypothetical protein
MTKGATDIVAKWDEKRGRAARLSSFSVQSLRGPGEPFMHQSAARGGEAVQRAQADPASLTSTDVLALQRTIGNRATVQMLAPAKSLAPRIPTARAVNTPLSVQRASMPNVSVQRSPARIQRIGWKNKLKSGFKSVSQGLGLTAAVSWMKTDPKAREKTVGQMSNDPFEISGDNALASLFSSRVDLLPYLIEYAKKEWATDNIEAAAAIVRYKQKSPTFGKAQEIFTRYIERGSDVEVNISNEEYKAVADVLSQGPMAFTPAIADSLFNQVFDSLMINIGDTWGRLTGDKTIENQLRVRTPIGRLMDARAGRKFIDTGEFPKQKRRTALQYLKPNMDY